MGLVIGGNLSPSVLAKNTGTVFFA